MCRCVWDLGGEEHRRLKVDESLTAGIFIYLSHRLTNVRRCATRAAKKCLSVDALPFLMLPFAASRIFASSVESEKKLVGAVGIELSRPLEQRKLFISRSDKERKNARNAEVGYTAGTRSSLSGVMPENRRKTGKTIPGNSAAA
jgi:hypothetical protein